MYQSIEMNFLKWTVTCESLLSFSVTYSFFHFLLYYLKCVKNPIFIDHLPHGEIVFHTLYSGKLNTLIYILGNIFILRIDLTNLLTIWSILHWQIWLWYTDERLCNWAKPPTKIQSSCWACPSLLVGWNWAILVHPEDSRKEIMYHIMVIFQLWG